MSAQDTQDISEGFTSLIAKLSDHARSNMQDWMRAGTFIQALTTMRDNFEKGLSVSGKATATGAKRGRKPKNAGASGGSDSTEGDLGTPEEVLENAEVSREDGVTETQYETDAPAANRSRRSAA